MLGVAHVLGQMLALFGVTFALPIATALIMRDGTAGEFVLGAAITSGFGLALMLATRKHARELKARDGFLLVTLGWLAMAAFSSVPLMLVLRDLSLTDAFFESMSGITTTGSTILSRLDELPPAVNMWRHALHWYGGLGIIVLAIAILPLLGVGGMQLYRAQSPGPVKDEKLTPRITETAKSLWLVYTLLTAICIVALKLCGMSWFDAICHGFSALALGGFSTHDKSVGYFDSPAIEMVLCVFMLIAALNFARHFIALRRATLAPYAQDPEGKAMVLLVGVSIIAVTALVYGHHIYPDLGTTLRHVTFSVISVATTTGFVTEDYEKWPVFAPLWMLFLCSVTCSTGSTGGGVKMFRTLVLARQAGRELKLLVHPSAVAPVRIGGKPVPDRVADSVLAFIFLYFVTVSSVTFALLITGLDFTSSFSAAVASINNMGPGLASVGPSTTFQNLTDLQTWICSGAMLLGRLEIFSVLVLFTPAFWNK